MEQNNQARIIASSLLVIKMVKWLSILVIVQYFICITGYKILVLSPLPGRSHGILGEGIVNLLSKAGHEVTYITGILPSKPEPGVTIIDVTENAKLLESDTLNLKTQMDGSSGIEFLEFIPMFSELSKSTIENPKVQRLLSDKNQKFDLVIVEWMFIEVYAGFAGVFNCPFIWFSSMEPHWMILQLVDEIPNPAYNVDIMSSSFPPLSFKERVIELGLVVFEKLLQVFYVSGLENDIYEKLFVPHIRNRGIPVPTLEALKYNASLILCNSHVSMGSAKRLPPNFIPIGGYHIDTAVKHLPEDLKKIMDNAKHGVIYFSMGSNLRSKHFPEELRQDLLKMFGELKQTVLWKFEDNLPNLPSNVHILHWAPQQSILAHKNCVLFITHGGLLSTTETIHYGVPVIGIPVFGDQFVNIARGVKKGYAMKVDLSYEMTGDLKIAIQEILANPKYTNKVKELSRIYHDRSVHPSKDLVHWVEHVLKTGGALHLRSPAFLMPWYQKLYLDLVM
ncbi:unnamed protein product, partial [Brenthis ino]